MKRKLITATMAAMMMASSAVPVMAMVGVEKPKDPEMGVITTIEVPAEQRPDVEILPVEGEKAKPVLYNKTPELANGQKVDEVEAYEHANSRKYLVKKGDTLWNIAKKALKTEDVNQIQEGVKRIVDSNNLENPDVIYTGDRLNLPAGL